jgi:hypothetical protein
MYIYECVYRYVILYTGKLYDEMILIDNVYAWVYVHVYTNLFILIYAYICLNICISINIYEYTGFDLMFGQTEPPAEVDPESGMGSLNEDAVPFQGQGITSASVRKRTALGTIIYLYIHICVYVLVYICVNVFIVMLFRVYVSICEEKYSFRYYYLYIYMYICVCIYVYVFLIMLFKG